MNRRAVLIGGGALLGLPALLAGLRRLGSPEPGPAGLDALRPLLEALPDATGVIGREMWEGEPWHRDRVDVAADLLDGWDGSDLAAWLTAQMRADHAAGRVRAVDRWLLSYTEARLLLLSARRP